MTVQTRTNTLSSALLLILSLMQLQGCATSGPGFTEVSPAPPGRAMIYLYRESRMMGAAGSFTIFKNGKNLVKLKNGGYLPIEVEAGPVVLSNEPAYGIANVIPWVTVLTAHWKATVDWEKEGALLIEAEPNKTYYVEWVLGGKLYQRSREEAMPILATTKRLEPME